MKARQILVGCDFGEDVADYDLELSQYFVETSSFLDVIHDRADLILGEKGSGKSAIFRHIAHSSDGIAPLRNVHVIPAFNTRGSVVFKNLSAHDNLPEEVLRTVWFTYLIALAANHLANLYPKSGGRQISRLLKKYGLHSAQSDAQGIWAKIKRILEALNAQVEAEGELKFDPGSIPVSLGIRGKLSRLTGNGSEGGIDSILDACIAVLLETGTRCWIVFDRLDEAFYDNPDLEAVALRSLLRAHLDLASHQSPLKSKLFLRSEILERVTVGRGFVNATHLRRQYLKWDRPSIVALIARRIMARPDVADSLNLEYGLLRNQDGRLKVCGAVLPPRIDHQTLADWFENCTTDGRGALNPRNAITLLKQARAIQLEHYDRDDPEYVPGRPLIHWLPIRQGLQKLSVMRMEDTVLAERPDLRPLLRLMQAKPARMTRDQLSAILRPAAEKGASFEQALQSLLDSGLIASGANPNILTVPELYRHALKLTIHRSSGSELDVDEVSSMQVSADAACRRVLKCGITQYILDADDVQRHVISDHVRANYPELSATEHRVRSTGFRAVGVRSKEPTMTINGRLVLRTDDPTQFDDAEILTMEASVISAFEEATSRRASTFTPKLPLALRTQVNDWSSILRRKLGGSVGFVADLQDTGGRFRAQFAPDIPGVDISAQEKNVRNENAIQELKSYLEAACIEVINSGDVARIRPLGDASRSKAEEILSTFPVKVSTETTKRGHTVLRVSSEATN